MRFHSKKFREKNLKNYEFIARIICVLQSPARFTTRYDSVKPRETLGSRYLL